MKTFHKKNGKAGPGGPGALLTLVICIACVTATLFAAEQGGGGDGAGQKSLFAQFIVAGGYIVWFVLIPMSMAAIYLITDLSLSLRRKKLLPDHIAADIESKAANASPDQLARVLVSHTDLVSRVLMRIIAKSKNTHPDKKYINHLASEALNEQALQLLRKVEWCNIIGNVAPMVGLFGTVFGMIKAFNILGISASQPRPDELAGAISTALITTFWGLLVAIPALAMHGVFRSRIEALVSEAAIEVETLLSQITLPHAPDAEGKGANNIPFAKPVSRGAKQTPRRCPINRTGSA
ncbi:Biopolymer transport protein ExbB [Anaerohalosphaera lusitana]|uniref:Biopolymer transport protein ExbB n=1 Tax=Anaerohalosphaera lusitana TaxID=1936003 RepID=A0A1U9NLH2_9BACT|nr:MotA/TolQ/ExbB proton channel family protein [Anaerohalosphaera lusitana]AQT68420.1 Biopolymer transport protein ExbB [Anaerohalosphaera lusitana]